MVVYLAGPIFGKSDADCTAWRAEARRLLNARVLDPMARDYRGREDQNVAEIVECDLEDIRKSDVVLVNALHGPSWGTAMEIVYAYTNYNERKRIVVVAHPPVSPWLRHHSTAVVPSVEVAAGMINGW